MQVFDLNLRQLLKSIPTQALGNPTFVYSVSLSPDDRLLALGTTHPRLIIWDMTEQKVIHTIPTDKRYYTHVAFSPTGEYLACVNESQVDLIATSSWKRVYSSPPGLGRAKFSPDGQYLAMGPQGEDGHIVVVDVESRERAWEVLYRADFSGMNIKDLKAPCWHIRFFSERGAVGCYTRTSLEQMTKTELLTLYGYLIPPRIEAAGLKRKRKAYIVDSIIATGILCT